MGLPQQLRQGEFSCYAARFSNSANPFRTALHIAQRLGLTSRRDNCGLAVRVGQVKGRSVSYCTWVSGAFVYISISRLRRIPNSCASDGHGVVLRCQFEPIDLASPVYVWGSAHNGRQKPRFYWPSSSESPPTHGRAGPMPQDSVILGCC